MGEELAEEPLVPISALNHYLYCERRSALIHVEGIFIENRFTLEGKFLHDRADRPGVHTRRGVRVAYAVALLSRRLGLVGKADIVELWHRGARPIDYKRGRIKKHDNLDVQLCAQALCLEEQLGIEVPEGAIFHAASKRRRAVAFDESLRDRTLRAIRQVRRQLVERHVPPARLTPRCRGCSLRSSCLPEATEDPAAPRRFVSRLIEEECRG